MSKKDRLENSTIYTGDGSLYNSSMRLSMSTAEDEELTDREMEALDSSHDKYKEDLRIPADVEKAIIHQRASGVGAPDESLEPCKFCNKPQKTGRHSWWCSSNSRKHHTMVMTNFLTLTKFCLILGLINLLGNLKFLLAFRKIYCSNLQLTDPGTNCSAYNPSTYVFHIGFLQYQENRLELARPYIDEVIDSMTYSKIASSVMLLSIFILIRIHFLLNVRYLRDARKDRSISEYTLTIKKSSGKTFTTGEAAKTDFKQFFDSILAQSGYNDDFVVVKKHLASSLFIVNKLRKEKHKLTYFRDYTTELAKDETRFNAKERGKLEKLTKRAITQLQRLEVDLHKERGWVRRNSFSHKQGEIADRVVLVTLSSRFTRDRILRSFKENYRSGIFCSRACKKKPEYIIGEGPEPTTVKWHYIGVSLLKSIIFCLIIATIPAAIVTAVAFTASYVQQFITKLKDDSSNADTYFSYVLSFQINIMQIIALRLVDFLGSLKRAPTNTNEMILKVMCSALIKFSILVVLLRDLFRSKAERVDAEEVQMIFKTLIIQIVLEPFNLLFSTQRLIRYYQMFRFKWMARKKDPSKIIMPQEELNAIFEKPEYPYSDLYSYTLYIMIIEFSCAPYIPSLSFMTSFYLIVKLLFGRLLLERSFRENKTDLGTYSENMVLHFLINFVKANFFFYYWRSTLLLKLFKGIGEKLTFFENDSAFLWYAFLIVCFSPLYSSSKFLIFRWKRRELDNRTEEADSEPLKEECEKSIEAIGEEFEEMYCNRVIIK